MKAWDVYLENEQGDDDEVIDTVFWVENSTADEVRRSLINHDGYDPDIWVVCEATGEDSRNE